MEQVRRPRKALFILATAIFWDGGINLLTWLSNRHDARRAGSVYHASAYYVVADLVVGFVFGIVFGVVMWYLRRQAPRKEVSRNKTITQNALFWGAMALLAVLLWKMW
jgi:MFS family permease